MSTESPENDSTIEDEDPKWLLQFYSASKSVEDDEESLPQPLPGIAISAQEKYHVGDEVGNGGMKSILRTLERTTQRNVAMAVLRDPSVNRRRLARFVREAR